MPLFQSYIPKTLDSVKHAEEDVIRLTSGQDTEDMYYKTITGLKQALPRVQPASEAKGEEEHNADAIELSENVTSLSNSCEKETESTSEEDEESSNESEGGPGSSTETMQTPVDRKTARKENKKKVKEEKREARKNKVPKAVKKRKKKLAKSHK